MSPLDVIPLPGHPDLYARRCAVDAWVAAGSPPPNSAGRLYDLQKYYWDGWAAREPGFNPADNPDDETQKLAHVRFVAFDIDPTPDRVRRLKAAGLIRPYSYEPWHWELPNVRQYPIVRTIPAATGGTTTPTSTTQEEPVFRRIYSPGRGYGLIGPGHYRKLTTQEEIAIGERMKTGPDIVGNDREYDVMANLAVESSG